MILGNSCGSGVIDNKHVLNGTMGLGVMLILSTVVTQKMNQFAGSHEGKLIDCNNQLE